MTKKQPNLAVLLADSAGSTRRNPKRAQPQEAPAQEKSRPHNGAVAITVHFPPPVRNQIKLIAVEQGRPMHLLIAEAYNDLFAKYGKPEIAPSGEGA
jgi:hypothetical protein